MNVLAMAAIAVGCVLMAIGTLGLGFRTLGVIALGPCIAMLVAGAISTLLGLTSEAAPSQPTARTARPRRPNPVSVHPNPWHSEAPERVRVASWRDEPRALPAARTALPPAA